MTGSPMGFCEDAVGAWDSWPSLPSFSDLVLVFHGQDLEVQSWPGVRPTLLLYR